LIWDSQTKCFSITTHIDLITDKEAPFLNQRPLIQKGKNLFSISKIIHLSLASSAGGGRSSRQPLTKAGKQRNQVISGQSDVIVARAHS
jgi:hypothetical protein